MNPVTILRAWFQHSLQRDSHKRTREFLLTTGYVKALVFRVVIGCFVCVTCACFPFARVRRDVQIRRARHHKILTTHFFTHSPREWSFPPLKKKKNTSRKTTYSSELSVYGRNESRSVSLSCSPAPSCHVQSKISMWKRSELHFPREK